MCCFVVDTEGGQDLGGNSLLILEQSEKKMLYVDELCFHLLGFVGSHLEDLFRPRSERDFANRHGATRRGDVVLHRLLHRLEIETEIRQNCDGFPFPLLDYAQQQMLGADVVVPKSGRFLPSVLHDPLHTVCKHVIHGQRPPDRPETEMPKSQ